VLFTLKSGQSSRDLLTHPCQRCGRSTELDDLPELYWRFEDHR
jgi:hypothetical protein